MKKVKFRDVLGQLAKEYSSIPKNNKTSSKSRKKSNKAKFVTKGVFDDIKEKNYKHKNKYSKNKNKASQDNKITSTVKRKEKDLTKESKNLVSQKTKTGKIRLSREEMRKAVIYSEILGKPKSLR